MERGINDILNNDDKYSSPYVNHAGYGTAMGAGDNEGKGYAFIDYTPKKNYNGKDIISFNGKKTYFINDYLILIKNVRFPWIKGEIIKNDFTTQPCYIGSLNNKFVVSDSIKSVFEKLKELINEKEYNESDLARAFVIYHPEYEKEYKWSEMLEWHTLRLNSCENGRKMFTNVCNKQNNDMITPKELVELIIKYSPDKKLGKELKKIYTH